jgi:hypothetical protein
MTSEFSEENMLNTAFIYQPKQEARIWCIDLENTSSHFENSTIDELAVE